MKAQNVAGIFHPQAAAILEGRGLSVTDPHPLSKDIGRQVRFRRPKNGWAEIGTCARDNVYTVVGVQKIFDGSVAYRVSCENDRFGRPARPENVFFVD